MAKGFGGLSVPAELYFIMCVLCAVFVVLVCIWLELILARLRAPRRPPGITGIARRRG